MEQHYDLIKAHSLFKDLSDSEIEDVFKNFDYRICEYKSDEKIEQFDSNKRFSLFMLSGNARVQKLDYDGSREIISTYFDGSIGNFPQNPDIAGSRVNVISNNESVILFMCVEDFFKPLHSLFAVQYKLMRNVIRLLDEQSKYAFACEMVLTERSIRKKISRYFEICKKRYGSSEFNIIYSRTELADCLGIDKSALSRELGNMKKDGLIDYKGNHFVILKNLDEP